MNRETIAILGVGVVLTGQNWVVRREINGLRERMAHL